MVPAATSETEPAALLLKEEELMKPLTVMEPEADAATMLPAWNGPQQPADEELVRSPVTMGPEAVREMLLLLLTSLEVTAPVRIDEPEVMETDPAVPLLAGEPELMLPVMMAAAAVTETLPAGLPLVVKELMSPVTMPAPDAIDT